VRHARTQPAIRAKKRKAPSDPAIEADDAKLRLLDTEIRWHSFLYHAWSNFQEAIGKIYGDIEPGSTEWVWARGRFQDVVKRYKNMVLDKMEVNFFLPIPLSINSCPQVLDTKIWCDRHTYKQTKATCNTLPKMGLLQN
jgi:hypothetical protein